MQASNSQLETLLRGYLGFGRRLIDRAVPILAHNVIVGPGHLAEFEILALTCTLMRASSRQRSFPDLC